MTYTETSPFEVLGITRDALRGLNEKNVLQLARAMWVAQSQVHHVDRGGKPERHRALNGAWESLDPAHAPGQLAVFLGEYLRKGKKKQKVDKSAEVIDISYMEQHWREAVFDQAMCRFTLPPMRLIVADNLTHSVTVSLNPMGYAAHHGVDLYELVWGETSASARRQSLLEKSYRPDRGETPPRDSVFHRPNRTPGHCRYWLRTGKAEPLHNLVLLGSTRYLPKPPTTYRPKIKLQRLQPKSADDIALAGAEAAHGFTFERFYPVLRRIIPVIVPHWRLIGVTDDPLRFRVLGTVLGLSES